ncbi:MAG: hydrogenase maturation protease [Gemmatimonadota bacterium]
MGNPLMGDDGVGWAVARFLEAHPRLPTDVYVAWGGTDLLATSSLLDGRLRVVLLQAVDGEEPCNVVPLDPDRHELEEGATGDHAESLCDTLALLRMLSPGMDRLDVRILGITVPRIRARADLSTTMREHLPDLAERVLAELARA